MSTVYVITRYQSKQTGFLLENDRLLEVFPDAGGFDLLGGIYVGKIQRILKNIGAAFVEIAGGQTGFLPLSEAGHAILTNRSADGRLQSGDELFVQVKKDAVKTKDPVLSARISLPGRFFCADIGGAAGIRYSARLTSDQKNRLESTLADLTLPDGIGLVVRTAAGELEDRSVIKRYANEQIQRAEQLISVGRTRSVYSLLSEQIPGFLKPFTQERLPWPKKVVTDEPGVYTAFSEYLARDTLLQVKLELYADPALSLSALYGLAQKLDDAFSRTVWLKSGGYLVIEPTEALTVIDVNTGKYTDRKQAEETFRLINAEAACEIARQLRLRNLSGIILADFINMKDKEANHRILSLLRQFTADDPVPVRIVDMTALGLVEITRQKRRPPLAEQMGRSRKKHEISRDGKSQGREIFEEL